MGVGTALVVLIGGRLRGKEEREYRVYLCCQLPKRTNSVIQWVISSTGRAHLVGLITNAPTSFLFSFVSRRSSFSRIGMTKARVFPDPVTASTTTSLWPIKRGMADACTGVI